MTPRRILEITSYPPPRAGWGVRVQFLKKHLEAQGHVCVVLNIGRSRVIPSPEYETVLSGLDYVRKVWRFSRRGFLVHMHVNGESPKGFVLSLLAIGINLVWGKRCVLTFHAGVDQLYFPRPKAPLLLPMYKVLFGVPRHIICNSEPVKEKICEYGVRPEKVSVIPAFSRQYLEYDTVQLPPHVEEFYRRHPHVVLTYIKLRPGFYQDTLLDGFALLAARRNDVGLVMCGLSGDIDPVLQQDLYDRIARHGLADRVCLIDDLDHHAFLTALSRSSLYLRTPTTDGVASSVLEALSLRVPVVGSENGSRPAGVITYRANDPTDLADTVARVLDNRAEVVSHISTPDVRDTLDEEANLLLQLA